MTNNIVNSSFDLKGVMSAQDVLEKAKLNWEAEKQPIFLANGTKVEDKFAVVRKDNGHPIDLVGNVYNIFQNKELALTLEALATEKLVTFSRGWCWQGGAKVGIVAELPKHLYVLGKDELAVEITARNSFDGSAPVRYTVDVLRLVCSNGLKRFVPKATILARHSANMTERLLAARETLGLAVNSVQGILDQAEKMARTQVTNRMVEQFLTDVKLNKTKDESTRRENQRFDLLARFDGGIGLQDPAFKHSAWALYNAATEFVDHRNGSADIEAKAVSAEYGQGARFKEQALKSILELVG